MSGLGSGRGRGWLKLNQNAEQVRPGIRSNTEHLKVQEKNPYEDLFIQMNHLNDADDGILLNKKLKHIRDVFMKLCPTEEDTKKVVEEIFEKCLEEENFSSKLIILITSAFFMNQKEPYITWRQNVSRPVWNFFQDAYEKRDFLRESSPAIFFKCIKLHFDYFDKLKHFGRYLHLQKLAISGYSETLLNHAEIEDIKMLTTIVCGTSEILIEMIDMEDIKLFNVLNKLKLVISTNDGISGSQKLLLFFLMDLISNKYSLRSDELKFYRTHLNKDDIREILIKYNTVHKLQLECHEDNNGINDTTEQNLDEEFIAMKKQQIDMEHKNSTFPEQTNDLTIKSHTNCQTYQHSSSNLQNDSGTDDFVKPFQAFQINENIGFSKPNFSILKTQSNQMGRPILGIGARLKKK